MPWLGRATQDLRHQQAKGRGRGSPVLSSDHCLVIHGQGLPSRRVRTLHVGSTPAPSTQEWDGLDGAWRERQGGSTHPTPGHFHRNVLMSQSHPRTRVEIPVARAFGLQAKRSHNPEPTPNPETHPVIPPAPARHPPGPCSCRPAKAPPHTGCTVILLGNGGHVLQLMQASNKHLLFLMGCPSLAQWPQGSLAWPARRWHQRDATGGSLI